MHTIHVYPVPRGMTPEQAWEELEVLGQFAEYRWWKPRFWRPFLTWAVMEEEP